MSDAVGRMLYEMAPKKIIVFDVVGSITWVQEELGQLPWSPEVVMEDGTGKSAHDYCLQVLESGKAKGAWDGSVVAALNFDEIRESIAMMPLLYSQGVPVVTFESGAPVAGIPEQMRGAKRILCSSEAMRGSVVAALPDGVDAVAVDTQLVLNENSATAAGGDDSDAELLVAPWSMSQWPYLLWCGCCAGNKNGALLLLDHESLDGMARGLDFLKQNSDVIKAVSFIDGSIPFEEADKEMLAWQALG